MKTEIQAEVVAARGRTLPTSTSPKCLEPGFSWPPPHLPLGAPPLGENEVEEASGWTGKQGGLGPPAGPQL